MYVVNNNQKINFNLNKNLIYTISNNDSQQQKFNYYIPVSLDLRSLNKIKKIKLDFSGSSTFSNVFNNKLFNETSDFKSHKSNNDFTLKFKEDIRKNIYPRYNNLLNINSQSLNRDESFISEEKTINAKNIRSFFSPTNNRSVTIEELLDFQSSYLNVDPHRGAGQTTSENRSSMFFSFIYIFPVGTSNSQLIYNNQINKIRISFFDENNNLISKYIVESVDFNNIHDENNYINENIYYYENFSGISENINLSFSSSDDIDNLSLDILGLEDLSTLNIIGLNVDIHSIETESRISQNYEYNSANRQTNLIRVNHQNESLDSFIDNLLYQYYFTENQNFEFDIRLSIDFNENESLNERFADSYNLIFMKSLKVNRNSSFFNAMLSNNRHLRYLNEIINNISLDQECEKINNDMLKVFITSNGSLVDTNVLKKIVVKEIKKNNVSIIQRIYTKPEPLFTNKANFIDKSLDNILNSGDNFSYYTDFNTKENNFSIKIGLELEVGNESIENNFNSTNFVFSNTSSEKRNLEKFNKAFSRCLKIEEIEKNLQFDEEKDSFFNIKNISVRNINLLSEFAQQFGYLEENTGSLNVVNFLNNCIIALENETIINALKFKNNKSNIFLFSDIFSVESIENTNQTYFNLRENFSGFVINTEDLYLLNTLDNSRLLNSLFVDYYKNNDDNLRYSILLDTLRLNKNIIIENTIKIYIMPIPKIISQYKGLGIDDNDNPINLTKEQSTQISSGEDILIQNNITINKQIRKNLSLALEDFFYSSGISLNYSKYKKFKEILMKSFDEVNIIKYYDIFDFLIKSKVSGLKITKFKNTINLQDEFIRLGSNIEINVDSHFENFKTQYLEENLVNNFFDINLHCQEENIGFEYYLDFKENLYYNQNRINYFVTKELNFCQDTRNLDLCFNLNSLLEYSDYLEITKINPVIRSCPIVIMTNNSGVIEERISNNINQTEEYKNISYNGKDCIMYGHKFIVDDQRLGIFENFTNSNLYYNSYYIEKIENNVNLKIRLNSSNQPDTFKNNFYSSTREFFDFCINKECDTIEEILERFSVSFSVKNKNNKTSFFTLYYNNFYNKKQEFLDYDVLINRASFSIKSKTLV